MNIAYEQKRKSKLLNTKFVILFIRVVFKSTCLFLHIINLGFKRTMEDDK